MADVIRSIGRMSQNITNVTATSPIVVTIVGHGLSDLEYVYVFGVTAAGITGADGNGVQIDNVTADTFELVGTTGTGTYTSGGTVARDYSSVYSWARLDTSGGTAGDLTGVRQLGYIYDDESNHGAPRVIETNTLQADIAGSTNITESQYRVLQAAPGHEYNPATGLGAKVWKRTTDITSVGSALLVSEDRARVLNIGFETFNDTAGGEFPESGTHYGIRLKSTNAIIDGVTVRMAIGTTTGELYCFRDTGEGGTSPGNVIRNCVALGSASVGYGAGHGFRSAALDADIRNCSTWGIVNTTAAASGSTRGFWLDSSNSSIIARNCVSVGTDVDFDYQTGVNVEFCAAGDASLETTQDLTVSTVTGNGTSPIKITTTTSHGISTGETVTVSGVEGNEAANGVWVVTKVDADEFTLNGSSPDGNYTTGGSVERSRSNQNNVNTGSIFSNPTYGDLRPRYAGALVDSGEVQSGFSTDIIGATRGAPWEIGAYDGYVVPTSPSSATEVISSIGSGKTYPTVQEWLDATSLNLVDLNERHIGQLYDQETLGTGIGIDVSGAVTDSGRYRHLQAAPGLRYNPITDLGAKIVTATSAAIHTILISESYFRITGIGVQSAEISLTKDDSGITVDAVRNVELDSVWVEMATGKPNNLKHCFWLKSGTLHKVRNCIGRGGTQTRGATNSFYLESTNSDVDFSVANRARLGSIGTGFDGDGSGCRVRNCISTATDFGYSATAAFSQSHNISSDSTASGPGSITGVTSADTLVDAANNDYRLPEGSLAVAAGIGANVSTDFDGNPRTAPHNIGAYAGYNFAEVAGQAPQELMRRTRVWDLVRPSDGASLFLTEHDAPLVFRGITYSPIGGFDASSTERLAGAQAADVEFAGPISPGVFEVDDILAGRWDNAIVTCRVIDPQQPFRVPVDETVWELLAFELDGEQWSASMVSKMDRLGRVTGDLQTRTCPYRLFSNDPASGHFCMLSKSDYIVAAVGIDSVEDDRLAFTVTVGTGSTEMPAQTDDYYKLGEIEWRTGDNLGLSSEIKTWDSSTGEITLLLQTKFPIQVTDTFDVYPGCDGRMETCSSSKFNDNSINFGGDRLVPGTSQTIRTPKP